MLRRARAWASAEIARLLHAEVVEARGELETSMHARVDALTNDVDREAAQREQTIAASLDRLASSLDAIAQQLAEQSRDHRASLAAVEFVVREMALASMRPEVTTAATVIGGTIEPSPSDFTIEAFASAEVRPRDGMGPDALADDDDMLVADPAELHVGCIVEVRSRFQNRWVDGFEIVEIVQQDDADRYRLARHADHVQLPVLFDVCDLRPLDVVDDIVIDAEIDLDANTVPLVADIARSAPVPTLRLEPDDPGNRR